MRLDRLVGQSQDRLLCLRTEGLGLVPGTVKRGRGPLAEQMGHLPVCGAQLAAGLVFPRLNFTVVLVVGPQILVFNVCSSHLEHGGMGVGHEAWGTGDGRAGED